MKISFSSVFIRFSSQLLLRLELGLGLELEIEVELPRRVGLVYPEVLVVFWVWIVIGKENDLTGELWMEV